MEILRFTAFTSLNSAGHWRLGGAKWTLTAYSDPKRSYPTLAEWGQDVDDKA
ncbi:hypothetical protein D9M68_1001490 [compost metagenome]